jgi:cobalt/nickel transport system permease protein
MTKGVGVDKGGVYWDDVCVEPDSLIHRLDARVRVLLAVLLALFVVWADKPLVLLSLLSLALSLALLARLPARETVAKVLLLDAFMVLLLLTLPFTVAAQSGETLFSLGPMAASRAGLEQALLIMIKANSVLLFMLALLATLETVALGHALHHLHAPDKLVHLLLFTVRYIDLLQREYRRLRAAMRARCFVARADRHTWRSYGYLFGMLLVRSLDRSQRVLAAMRCRGFDGRFHRFRHPAATRLDAGFVVLSLLLLGVLAAWELA